MTITYYTAEYTDGGGDRYHASIFWDKYSPGVLFVQLGRYLSQAEVDNALWEDSDFNNREGLEKLKDKLFCEALRLGLSLVSEKETRFAPKAE
jgi:hypothetical protein